jgi:hypothetical protein
VAGPRSSNLTDFLALRGDQAVVVPNGTYRGGFSDVGRAATSGPYKGWLVLVAESPGGAVVDLAGTPLELGPNSSRVMFVGFKFVNGSIYVEGHDINFWYTDHSFPANVWASQSSYRAPRTVYTRDAERVRFFGSKLHDTGTAMVTGNSEDILLEGVEIWNLSDMGVDPRDVVHPDAIGAVKGNTLRFTLSDSWVRGRIMFIDADNGEGGPHRDLLFQRLWVSDSPSAGFTFSSVKGSQPYGVFGARRDVWSWGHNNRKDRIDNLGGAHVYTGNTQPHRVNVIDTNVHASPPPAGMPSPPEKWRATHPYAAWVDALADV